jgi:hypothetical protein
VASPKDWLGLTQAHHLADKIKELALVGGEMPIEPRHRRILAVRIVIASLGSAELIAARE